MKRFYALTALMLCLSLLCACNGGAAETTAAPTTVATEATTVPTTVATEPPVPEGLDTVRGHMEDTPELFAVAFLGRLSQPVEDLGAWITENNPQLVENAPFIPHISQIIGTQGEVYCVVPRYENTTVLAEKLEESQEGGLVAAGELYSAQTGEPFLLLCNSGELAPDTQVTFTVEGKEPLLWCVGLLDESRIDIPAGWEGEFLAWDMSLYEASPDVYASWFNEGWGFPADGALSGTSWSAEGFVEGKPAYFFMDLNKNGTARFEWLYQGDTDPQEVFTGKWKTYIENRAFLEVDWNRTGGSQHQKGTGSSIFDTFVILTDETDSRLLIGTAMMETHLPMDMQSESVFGIFNLTVG